MQGLAKLQFPPQLPANANTQAARGRFYNEPMNTLPRKKLPISIQTFREIREEGCYYVDKSGIAIDLIASGKYYF